MSRGFGATYGTSANDLITTTFVTGITGKRSYSFWAWDDGTAGGGSLGRILAKDETFFYDNWGGNVLEYNTPWTTPGVWTIVPPSSSVWHHHLITYDIGSLANVPIWYVDGVSQTTTRQVAPAGSVTSGNVAALYIGNRSTLTRNWGGKLARFSIWDGILLTVGEALALRRGASPWRIRPSSLVVDVPLQGLVSPEPQFYPQGTATVSGALRWEDPPVQPFTLRGARFEDFVVPPDILMPQICL